MPDILHSQDETSTIKQRKEVVFIIINIIIIDGVTGE